MARWIPLLPGAAIVLAGVFVLLQLQHDVRNIAAPATQASVELVSPASPPNHHFLFQNSALLRRKPSKTISSSFYCIEGEAKEAWDNDPHFRALKWDKRLCLVQNVEFNARRGITYFNPTPNALPYALDFPRGHPSRLQPGFVDQNEFQKQFGMEIQFENRTAIVPSWNQTCYIFASCGYGKDGFGGNEPGHDYDGVWSIFSNMADMGMLSTTDNILVLHHCKQYSRIFTLLADQVLRVEDLSVGEILPCAFFSRPRQAWYGFPNTLTTPLHGALFREFVYARLGIEHVDLRKTAHRHQIGVSFKRSRHRFPNHAELIAALRTEYAHCCDVVDLRFDGKTPSLREEVLAISKLSVYITPSGGGSFSMIFLPHGATAIIGNPCWPGREKVKENSHGTPEFEHLTGQHLHCYRMENYIWTRFAHFNKRYLSAQNVSDLLYDHLEPRQYGLPRHLGYSFNVSLEAVRGMIDEALMDYL